MRFTNDLSEGFIRVQHIVLCLFLFFKEFCKITVMDASYK